MPCKFLNLSSQIVQFVPYAWCLVCKAVYSNGHPLDALPTIVSWPIPESIQAP